MAGLLYDSLYTKILPLADDITVYPAHGAGSACGKNMMKETADTLGNQKKVNYALNQTSKEAFIKAVTQGLLPPPAYFGMNVMMNRKGYESLDRVLSKSLTALSADTFQTVAEQSGTLILDTRSNGDFWKGFIPQSINIGLNGEFAPSVGAMIVDVHQPILLITDSGMEEEAVTRLSRVGFDRVIGYLKGGFRAWADSGKETDTILRITAKEFARQTEGKKPMVIDVRKESEYAATHVEDAYSKPLLYINDWISDINPAQPFYLHCAGGYRSMIAASILQARGYRNFIEIEGGIGAIAETQVPKTDFVCKSKILK